MSFGSTEGLVKQLRSLLCAYFTNPSVKPKSCVKLSDIIESSLLIRELTGIKSPKWHEEILFDRKEKIEKGKANFKLLVELKSKHEK